MNDFENNHRFNDDLELLQDDASYPKDWDIEYFKALPNFKKRVEYAKEKLGRLGSGSARIVFEIDPNTVLKLARNKKGLAQNELEAEIAETGWYDFVARVVAKEPNYLWIESEKAQKMKKSDFRKLVGYKFENFTRAIVNEARKNRGIKSSAYYIDPEEARKIYDDDFFNEILSFVTDYDIAPGDFARISSWGVVKRDGKEVPVLIDYGISWSIYQDFYAPKTF